MSASVIILVAVTQAWAGGQEPDWQPAAAARYLDDRATAWYAFGSAGRGQGASRISCISCHTLVPYALARPVLGKIAGEKMPAAHQQKLIQQVQSRVGHWKDLDSAPFSLFYDFSDQKKKESWGTEAVLNALVLAFDDHYEGKSEVSAVTRQAFANLWETQTPSSEGNDSGSWEWLDFKLEPWETKGARYHGATLAAIAVGTAPGYIAGSDAALAAKIDLLRGYLKAGFASQNQFNRLWALWASARLDGILTKHDQKVVIEELLAKQRPDGGWSLPSLG
jgi:squalene-hopene/tetraprenyl-beta-curcumene cyclase